MPAHYTLHGPFLLPVHSRIFIAWFLCVPNYTADRFLKRKKRIWKGTDLSETRATIKLEMPAFFFSIN